MTWILYQETSMRCCFVSMIAAVALIAPSAASAEDPASSSTIEIISDQPEATKAAPAAFVTDSKPCGSAADLYHCLSVTPDQPGPKTLPTFIKVTYPGRGRATVTWHGNVFCDTDDRFSNGGSYDAWSQYEYYVHLAIKDDDSALVYNAPGAASLGERFHVQMRAVNAQPAIRTERTTNTPVSLLRVFKVKGPGTVIYHTVVLGDFRLGGGERYCNVNGGTMTVQFMPG